MPKRLEIISLKSALQIVDVIPGVTVDGPSGSGKGMVATHLAAHYGFRLLDSGALYRLVGIAARWADIDLDLTETNQAKLSDLAENLDVEFKPTGDPENPSIITLSGKDVTRQLRSNEAGVDASVVAAIEGVRDALTMLQHSFRREPGLVADGRDMGTVVFPDAIAKLYLTASSETRAQRRYKQLKDKDISVSLPGLFQSIQSRDERDKSRKVSPLVPAEDAYVIDSTSMTIDEVLDVVLSVVTKKLG